MSKVKIYCEKGEEYLVFPIDAAEAIATGIYFATKPEVKAEEKKPVKRGPKTKSLDEEK